MTVRVDVARGALLEVGREDLAKHIYENRIGDPSCRGGIYIEGRPADDSHLIVRAMRLGHLADPEGAPVGCGRDGTPGGSFPACDGCRGECDLGERQAPPKPDALAAPPERAYRGPMADDTETCPRCDGEGLVATRGASVMVDQAIEPPATPCPVCGGKGRVASMDRPTSTP